MASSVTITPFVQLMIDARHTVPSLAGATGLNPSTVRKVLAERTVHADTAALIARALKVSVEEAFPSDNYVIHGHPPQVSHSYGARSSAAVVPCPHCFMALPATGVCDDCG